MHPNEVFVPGKFPIDARNAYADRGEPQASFRQSLDRGFVPVLYGSYGVGKSSLAAVCAKPWRESKRLVYVETVYAKTLADILRQVLEFLGYSVVTETRESDEKEAGSDVGFELGGGIWGALKASISGKLSRKRKKALAQTRVLLVSSPTDSRVMDLCEAKGLLLVLDELHRASPELLRDLAAFLKAYANRNHKQFKIALLGTSADASKLVARDPGVDRCLQEVKLHPLKESEAKSIVTPGMAGLGLRVEGPALDSLVKSSVGSPFIVQFLCLEAAEAAIQRPERLVTAADVKAALARYATAKAPRMIRAYRLAIETVGEKRYRKQVLHAMARVEDEYVTMDQIVRFVSEQLGEAIPSTALSGPLRDLKTPQFGSILSDIPNLSGDARMYNYSCFSDPAMRAVIRFIEEIGIDNLPEA